MTDRELNALVAENVMGREVIRRPYSKEGPCLRAIDSRQWVLMPNYSTDIAAAWEVEESLMVSKKKRDIWRDYNRHLVEMVGHRRMPGEFNGRCDQCDTDMTSYTVETGDITHASPRNRCLAALKAVGVEVPA